MRQRNEIELFSGPLDAKTATNNLIKLSGRNELRDRQFPDRDDEPRLQDFEFAIQPRRAVFYLLRLRNPVVPARRLARETTTHRREIDFLTHRFFRQTDSVLKPAEERFACSPGKRSSGDRLPHPWRLTNNHDPADDRS